MTTRAKTEADRRRAVRLAFFLCGKESESEAVGHLDSATIHDLIAARSIDASVLSDMRSKTGLSTDEVSRILGISARTMARRETTRETLTIPEADRAIRLARVVRAAIESVGDREKAVRWLRKANVALGGSVPLSLIETEPGTELVLGALDRIAYGGVV